MPAVLSNGSCRTQPPCRSGPARKSRKMSPASNVERSSRARIKLVQAAAGLGPRHRLERNQPFTTHAKTEYPARQRVLICPRHQAGRGWPADVRKGTGQVSLSKTPGTGEYPSLRCPWHFRREAAPHQSTFWPRVSTWVKPEYRPTPPRNRPRDRSVRAVCATVDAATANCTSTATFA